MKGAERMDRAINYQKPDKVPKMFSNYRGLLSDVFPLVPLTPKSWQPSGGKYPHIPAIMMTLGLYKWEQNFVGNDSHKNYKEWRLKPRLEIDEWGVEWECGSDYTMGWPIKGPLDEWNKIDELNIPNFNDPDRYKFFSKLNKLVPKASKYRMGNLLEPFFFARTHFLRGWNNYMVDLVRNQDKIRNLIKRIMPGYEEIIHQLHQMGAQCIFTTDDLGSQEDVFFSPRTFDAVFKDAYKHITNLCHDLGMSFVLHSCGNIASLIPNLIDAGVDCLQLDSPRMTGLEVLEQYNGKIAIWAVLDIQTKYPFANKKEIHQEVKEMIDKLGSDSGGLALMDYLDAPTVLQVPKQNVIDYYKAAKKYGHYSSDGRIDKTNW